MKKVVKKHIFIDF